MSPTVVPHTLLRYRLAADYLARRGQYRAEHLALVGEHRANGSLILAGALAEPADEALLIFATDDTDAVEAFAERDPYVRAGLVETYEVRTWSVVTGRATGG